MADASTIILKLCKFRCPTFYGVYGVNGPPAWLKLQCRSQNWRQAYVLAAQRKESRLFGSTKIWRCRCIVKCLAEYGHPLSTFDASPVPMRCFIRITTLATFLPAIMSELGSHRRSHRIQFWSYMDILYG